MKNLFYLIFFAFSSILLNAQTVYVATNGNDSNDGSISSPFRTFAKAVSVMSAGDVCIIRGGVYEEVLSINKNGTSSNYLTFKAADGEIVDIRSTKKVNGWQQHSGSIYKATINMSIPSRYRAVYHNEEYMDLARWPNNTDNNRWTVDCHPVDGGGGGNHITASGIPNIDWANGGLLYYFGAHSGTSWTRPITASSTTRIDHEQVDISKWPFSIHNAEVWRNYPGNNRGQFFLFNKLEALDHPREWYYDAATTTLYFQTANGNMPADGTVEYANTQYGAELSGDYIILEGLNFFGGAIKINNNADNNQILNCKVTHGIEGHDSLTNTSAQVGEGAIETLGDNTIIKGCTINHSAVSGIIIAGWAATGGLIEGNYISNTDYVGIHASPIRSGADNMKILKNTITNTGRDGIYVAGVNNEIAYNDVSRSQKINSDSGVFYTVGNDNLRNFEIHHNWFHDATAPSYSHKVGDPAKAAGIYLDNNSKGFVVHHNVVWNVSWSAYQVNWNNTNLDFFHNTIWNAERAMDSWVNGYAQSNNKIYNNYSNVGDWFTGNGTNEFDIQDNLISTTSPLEDPANKNFMPKVGSAVVDQAQVISGFNKPFQGTAPDIGAYELGGTMWTAGVNAIEDTGVGELRGIYEVQFSIVTSSETCPNSNNGTLNIMSDFYQPYVLSFNGSNTEFTNTLNIDDIAPGTYDLCIKVKDETESKCFVVEIKAASEITGKSSLSKDKLSVNIEQGTAPFKVLVNDELSFETFSTSFSVDVIQNDTVKITSSKDCEGEIVKEIDFYSNINANPNPTSGEFAFALPLNEGRISIDLYNIHSQLISSKLYSINSGKVNLSLSDMPSGIYFARINGIRPINVKIIKN